MHELDQKQLHRACERTASGFDEADFICATTRERLFERLDLFTLQPQRILDLGCGTGSAVTELRRRYPDALVVSLDWSENMLQEAQRHTRITVCADSHRIPLADQSVDIVVSNMMLPGCTDPEAIFKEARRVLRSPGVFLFSTLGPDTLKEVRRAWAQVEQLPHVHVFPDMHNVGDALAHASFREPVMDVEMLTINYSSLDRLITDLRAVAATNVAAGRRQGLTTPRRWQQMTEALAAKEDSAGKLPVSVEIVTGQAWAGAADKGVRMEDGVASFPISRIGRNNY